MIPEAREVRISRKDRNILEARCRSPVTLQRDLKRARIVLLAAEGRSTRSIAKEVGVQPRIVSLWRHRFADRGLEGLEDKPRPGKVPIYTKATGKRILVLLDKPAPTGFARWTGPLLAAAQTLKLHEHLRGLCRIPVPEFNEVIVAAFQSLAPVRQSARRYGLARSRARRGCGSLLNEHLSG
jgi:transposase